MPQEFFETMPPQEKEAPKRRFLVVSNVSGQSFKEWTTAKSPEDAILKVAWRLQEQNPKISFFANNFVKKAKATELPPKENR